MAGLVCVYPLLWIDVTPDCLHGSKYFSPMDHRLGYWLCKYLLTKKIEGKLDGLFEFKVMPFGLCNTPTTSACMMDQSTAWAQFLWPFTARPGSVLPSLAWAWPRWTTSHSGLVQPGPTEGLCYQAHSKPNSAEEPLSSARHRRGQMEFSWSCHWAGSLMSLRLTWHLTGCVSGSHCHYLTNHKIS